MKRQAATHNLFRTFLSLSFKLTSIDPVHASRVGVRRKLLSVMMAEQMAKNYMAEQADG